jgi:hypothetical protein
MTVRFSNVPATIPATVLRRHIYDTPHKTAVVLGLPQGGTSMLAAVVDALGVLIARPDGYFMNFEGQENRPCVNDDLKTWASKAAAWNDRSDVWGLKDTIIWRHPVETIHAALRNPFYLVAARDPVAIMQRRAANHAVVEPQHLWGLVMIDVVSQQESLWKWIASLPDAPLLVVSYERALRAPEATCRLVAEFLALQPTDVQLRRAVERIGLSGGYFMGGDNA